MKQKMDKNYIRYLYLFRLFLQFPRLEAYPNFSLTKLNDTWKLTFRHGLSLNKNLADPLQANWWSLKESTLRFGIQYLHCAQVNPALLYNHVMILVLYLTGFFLERKPCTICSLVGSGSSLFFHIQAHFELSWHIHGSRFVPILSNVNWNKKTCTETGTSSYKNEDR